MGEVCEELQLVIDDFANKLNEIAGYKNAWTIYDSGTERPSRFTIIRSSSTELSQEFFRVVITDNTLFDVGYFTKVQGRLTSHKGVVTADLNDPKFFKKIYKLLIFRGD